MLMPSAASVPGFMGLGEPYYSILMVTAAVETAVRIRA